MNNDNDFEKMLQEIMMQNGIRVSKNDPIMVVYTMHQLLMQRQQQQQQSLLQQFKSEIELLATSWSDDTKTKSERILQASLEASKAAMVNAMQENAKVSAKAIQTSVDTLKLTIDHRINETRKLTLINLVVALITLGAACAVFMGVIRP